MTVYTVMSFVKDGQGGNPAGVVLLEAAMPEDQMLAIAKDMGYSETAFVQRKNADTFILRFFTPVDEVDLCGHATIASFELMKQLGLIAVGGYWQETKAGLLAIDVQESGVYMEMAAPSFHELVDSDAAAAAFGIEAKALLPGFPVQCVNTGLKDIMLPVASLEVIQSMKPDFTSITALSKQYDAVGFHVFSLETVGVANAHARNFAPLFGIDEESATGTANGALTAYLRRYQPGCGAKLVFEQGYEMLAPSEIKSYVLADGRVFVGGMAIVTSKSEMKL